MGHWEPGGPRRRRGPRSACGQHDRQAVARGHARGAGPRCPRPPRESRSAHACNAHTHGCVHTLAQCTHSHTHTSAHAHPPCPAPSAPGSHCPQERHCGQGQPWWALPGRGQWRAERALTGLWEPRAGEGCVRASMSVLVWDTVPSARIATTAGLAKNTVVPTDPRPGPLTVWTGDGTQSQGAGRGGQGTRERARRDIPRQQ